MLDLPLGDGLSLLRLLEGVIVWIRMPVRRSGTEAGLKRQVMKMLAAEYPAAMVRKRHGTVYTTNGDPDLSILWHGIHVECELKRFGLEPTPLQAHRLEEWRQAGAVVAVIHTVGEMRSVMRLLPELVGLTAA